MVASTAAGDSYSPPTAFVYIFNLVVGVGALALPAGFRAAGLILGLIFLAVVGFLAYITVTWINEVQATANAVLLIKERAKASKVAQSYEEESHLSASTHGSVQVGLENIEDPLLDSSAVDSINSSNGSESNIFSIKKRVELGLCSEMFLGSIGHKLFYVVLVAYLYGDLAIYAVTIPTSLAKVTGGWCAGHWCISSYNVYFLYLAFFVVLIVPWSFFNFQKTKPLQIVTLFTRNLALFTMIILGLIYIGHGEGAPASELPWFDVTGIPSLFGVAIYAFMCHHSLPSLISPIEPKSYLNRLLAGDFVMIYAVYSLLCGSALFAFGDNHNPDCASTPGPGCMIQPLYTLNFTSYDIRPIAGFLSLFPVFTLSTNFPLIAITLRNNLMILIPWGEKHRFFGNIRIRQIIFALIATIPPICVAFATRSVDLLVGVTGSYAGLGIMFVIPGFLLVFSRRLLKKLQEETGQKLHNPHQSPFGHMVFVVTVGVASVVSLGLITFNLIYKAIKH
jgi:amino acid permease